MLLRDKVRQQNNNIQRLLKIPLSGKRSEYPVEEVMCWGDWGDSQTERFTGLEATPQIIAIVPKCLDK